MKTEPINFEIEVIRDHIIDELAENKRLLYNELDLQMFVARALEQVFKIEDGYIVHFEYRLPKGWSSEFDEEYKQWGETPYFDIVLEDTKQTRFIGIELKYKLKKIDLPKSTDMQRFGCTPNSENAQRITLVSNQGAENEGRYDFWKDVKRLELLGQCFDNVVGGIAIFVTNQLNYMPPDEKHDTNKYSCFNLTKNKKGFLYWRYDGKESSKICQIQCECGGQQCRERACGERLKKKPERYNQSKDGIWGSKWCHFVRPNFSLKQEYSGIWSKHSMQINTGTEKNPKIEKFYSYSVVVPKVQSNA